MCDFAGKFFADMTGNYYSSCLRDMTKLAFLYFLFTHIHISCMKDIAIDILLLSLKLIQDEIHLIYRPNRQVSCQPLFGLHLGNLASDYSSKYNQSASRSLPAN
jgi:hypothetical protein